MTGGNPARPAVERLALWAREQLTGQGALSEREAYEWFFRILGAHSAAAAGWRRTPDEALRELPQAFTALFPMLPSSPKAAAVSARLGRELPPAVWKDPEVCGWLYQGYFGEEKARRIAEKGRYGTADLPLTTELFTPRWLARYLVQNSLGRLLVEEGLTPPREDWEFYFPRPASVPPARLGLSLPEIRVLDPCVGGGHLLLAAFDLLLPVYRAHGIQGPAAARSILEHNLRGLDIDARVCRLARWLLLLHAGEIDPALLTDPPAVQIHTLRSADGMALPAGSSPAARAAWERLRGELSLSPLCGCLLTVDPADGEEVRHAFLEAGEPVPDCLSGARLLGEGAEVVVTNPPFLGARRQPPALYDAVCARFPAGRADLFAACMERSRSLCRPGGQIGLLTPYAWMFLRSYRRLREELAVGWDFTTLVQLEFNAFESAGLPVCAFTVCNRPPAGPGIFLRLSDFRGAEAQPQKLREAAQDPGVPYRYEADPRGFQSLPGCPFAYWAGKAVRRAFREGTPLREVAALKQGMATTDNARFVRQWTELPPGALTLSCRSAAEAKQSGRRWFPYQKGGRFRKWYGNQLYAVDFAEGGRAIKQAVLRKYPYLSAPGYVVKNEGYYFREGLTWTFISVDVGVRYSPPGFIFDVAGSTLFPREKSWYLLGFLCSKLPAYFLQILNPTMNVQAGDMGELPVLFSSRYEEEISRLSRECVALSKADWDSFELSWEFRRHPLVGQESRLSEAFARWEREAGERFDRVRANEQRINERFLELYGLAEALSPEVAPEAVTVRRADRGREARSLVSYIVGCLFGRYEQAGFTPLPTPLLPLSDLPREIERFLAVAYGTETLEENLQFLACSLTARKEDPCAALRRYADRSFYRDHLRTYRHRPIYLLFDGGVPSGRALAYVHHWPDDLLAQAARLQPPGEYRDRLLAGQAQGVRPDPDEGVRRTYEKLRDVVARIDR